jgi:hypothetical protein
MKRTTTTIAALVVAAVAAGAALPALAQDQGPAGPRDNIASRDGDGPGMKRHIERRGPGGGGFLALNCGPDAGDRLAHMLLGLEQRTDPTGEQVALFEAFESAATAAQADFAASCPIPPAEGETAARNLIDSLTTRLEVEEARLAAMQEVLPAFTAFYTSLSDEQKAALEPRGDRDGRRGPHGGPGMDAPAPAPMNG